MLEHIRKEGCTIPAVIADDERLRNRSFQRDTRRSVRGLSAQGHEPPKKWSMAIRRVAAGELVVRADHDHQMIRAARRQPEDEAKNSLKLLTDREREILQLLSRAPATRPSHKPCRSAMTP